MSTEKKIKITEEGQEGSDEASEAAAEEAAETAAEADAEAEVQTEAGSESDGVLTYEELQTQAADYKDQLLRALAEAENTRRRAERDKQDASKYAIASFARDILSVADNLARALDAVPAEARESDDAVKNLVLGIEMTQKELESALEKSGVKPVEALGKPFDPNFHQAMFELDDPDAPAGAVVQEVQRGYTIFDRLLRPAMVAVAKGGAKPAPAETPAEAEGEAEPAAEEPERPGAATSAYEKHGGPTGSKLDKKL